MHETEILEDKVGQVKQTNEEMKQKIGNPKHQQDNQTSFMTQQIGKCNQASSSFSITMTVRRQVTKWS